MIVCTRTYVARVRFGIRVRVRDSGIFEKGGYRCSGTRQLKNYYLYFLYIFTIKIFLKNTLLCLDPHKKKKKKASFGFSGHIQGRFWPISAVSGMFWPFLACFDRIGRQPIRPDMDDMAQFWPNQPGSAWIKPRRHESSRVSESEKKKIQTQTNARATVSDAASSVGPRLTRVRHLWCRVRAF